MTAAVALPPPCRLVALEATDSTNDEARARAADGAPAFTIVWARRQERGRGRQGRVWSSPEGNLYSSFVLRPGVPLARAAELSFVAALAVAEALEALLPDGAAVRLKWPNDVLVDGRKIAGILLESAPDGVVIAGIGINVARAPVAAATPATTIAAEGGLADIALTLAALAAALVRWHGLWRRDGFAPVRTAWLARAHGIGDPVRVRLAADSFEGRFVTLDADGALLVEPAGGPVRRVTAGDVFFPAAA